TWLVRSPKALMTFPSANRPLFICTDSLKRSPVFPVFVTRSEPARSTKYIVKMACERLECSFICVVPVIVSSEVSTSHSLAPMITKTIRENRKYTTMLIQLC
uniref:Uncharacterized protein n=1 Tax=Callorhinchus milii TaxID=7868 RepID=A0A4W3JLE8_CALMI